MDQQLALIPEILPVSLQFCIILQTKFAAVACQYFSEAVTSLHLAAILIFFKLFVQFINIDGSILLTAWSISVCYSLIFVRWGFIYK